MADNFELILFSLFYIVTCFLVNASGHSRDVRSEFFSHQLIEPSFSFGSILPGESLPKEFQVSFEAYNQTFAIDLHEVENLIPYDFFEKYHQNGSTIINKNAKQTTCHFQGYVFEDNHSWSALSGCDGTLSGVITLSKETYYIHPFGPDQSKHLLFRHSELIPTIKHCGIHNDISKKRRKRSPLIYKSNADTRYLELLIVNDKREFEKFRKDKNAVLERTKTIVNIVNALFRPLNIFIALVGVVTWTDRDEILVSASSNKTLDNFLEYRATVLNKEHPNDSAHLITGISFEQGVVGKAQRDKICNYHHSGGVSCDHSDIPGIVASTLAHEIGHNLGLQHDTKSCHCPSEKCIMSETSGSESIQHWSSCSKEYLKSSFAQGMDYCLLNPPAKIALPNCGNGILDEGEKCDCGPFGFCDSSCCNATTCQLTTNATCASGPCCDLNTCKFREPGIICRPGKEKECDLPEYCDGYREECPVDVFKQYGAPCANGAAYCYKGQCFSHQGQCRLLWGATASVASWDCYSINTKGNHSGNCGYSWVDDTFTKCAKQDILCGRLQCVHFNNKLEFGAFAKWKEYHSHLTIEGVKKASCQNVMFDYPPEYKDPGLVGDGAKCGTNKMCVDQRCRHVEELKTKDCLYDCYGRGVCNSKGNCHCDIGAAPPYCNYPGAGGSVDSNAASNPNAGSTYIIAFLIFFLGVCPCLLVTLFLLHRHRNKLSLCYQKGTRPPRNLPPPSKQPQPKPPILRLHENPCSNLELNNISGVTVRPLPKTSNGFINTETQKPLIATRPAPPPPQLPSANTTNTKVVPHLHSSGQSNPSKLTSSAAPSCFPPDVIIPNKSLVTELTQKFNAV